MLRIFRHAYEMGCGTVFCPDGHVRNDDFLFRMKNKDAGLFHLDHPIDMNKFTGYDVRTVYESLVLITHKQVPEAEYIHKTGNANETLIDLGSFASRRFLGNFIQERMKKADWNYEQIADPKLRASQEQYVFTIKEDLALLCNIDQGQPLAAKLWSRNVPATISPPACLSWVAFTKGAQGSAQQKIPAAGRLPSDPALHKKKKWANLWRRKPKQ